jgi:predicted anti-sigma-YlaC factor YlaD
MTDEHARIEELLSAVQDGAATPEEAALVQRHLATCAQCRATAAAFEQIDRQVRRYLMATPVPEMAAPWRNEPLVTVAPRRRGSPGHWRITTVGLSLVFALLFAATALTFFQRDTPQQATEFGSAQPAAAQAIVATTTLQSAPALAAPAASSAPAAAAGAAAPSGARSAAAPSAAASSAAASSAAASSAAASAASSTRPSAAPSAAAAASGAAPPAATAQAAATPATAASTASADSGAVNPTRAYRLDTATAFVICSPACDAQPQPDELLRRLVAALDQPLAPAPPAPSATVPPSYVTLRFTLAGGQLLDIGYYPQLGLLQLPDGRPPVAAPADFVAALAAVLPPP